MLKKLPLLLCLVLLCSCSRVKLAYRFSDWMIASQAHKFLKLDHAQEKQMKADIKAYMAWHRRNMLPAYAEACKKLAKGLRGEEKPEENIPAILAMGDTLYAQTMRPMIGPTAGLLASLNDAQIAHVKEVQDKELAGQKTKYTETQKEDSTKKNQKAYFKFLEEFTGKISQEQRDKIIALPLRVTTEAWMADKEKRNRELIALLYERKGQPSLESFLASWWLRDRSKPDPTRMDPKEVQAYFVSFYGILDESQRLRAAEKLEGFARDFEELAATD